jgi:hypothetical protein
VRESRQAARNGSPEPVEAESEAAAEPASETPGPVGLRASLPLHPARRLALSRLAPALLFASVAVCLLGMGGQRAFQSVRHWLHGQPAFQAEFSAIALDPPPPPWIKTGRAGLLEEVRRGAGQPVAFSLLELDPKELERAFALHSPWVKRVVRIERGPAAAKAPAVRVRLVYREPVAYAETRGPIVVDEDGVVLPAADLDLGAAGPLMMIAGLPANRYWGSPHAAEDLLQPDARVLAAARLAGFIKRHQERKFRADGSLPPWCLVAINPTFAGGLIVQTRGNTQIVWGTPPGSEKPGDLTAEQKWNLLTEGFERGTLPQVQHPSYLEFRGQHIRVESGRFGAPASGAGAQ